MTRVSEKIVADLPLPDKAPKFYPFSGATLSGQKAPVGFGVTVTPAGVRSFGIRYRIDGTERRMTFGRSPDWPVLKAIKEAKALRRRIDKDEDPLAEKQARHEAATVAELCGRFAEEYIPTKRPSTQIDYILHTEIVRKRLGSLKVDAVTSIHIQRLHQAWKHRPYKANRILALASSMFTRAIEWKYIKENPCSTVKRFSEDARERYLAPKELGKLSEVLNDYKDQTAANVIRMLLLTGCRKTEALSARWEEFDFNRGTWTKPSASTKQAKQHVVPLGDDAALLLQRIKAETEKSEDGNPVSPFVFPGRTPDTRLGELTKPWQRIRRAAGISDVRLHDLRHTYASMLVSSGASLPMIGALLGHTQASTTLRYAHLFDDPLRKLTNVVGAQVMGKPSADVVPIKKDQSA
jgi:integrase